MSRSRSESSLCSSSHKSGSHSGSDQPWPVADWPTASSSRPAVGSGRGYPDHSLPATNMHKVFSSSQESSVADSSLSSDNISAREPETVEHHDGQSAKYSAGSDLHNLGQCSPCAWNWRPAGCVNGSHCSFCHMCEEGEIKQRRKNRLVKLKSSKSAVASAAPSPHIQMLQQDPNSGSSAQVDRRRNLPKPNKAYAFNAAILTSLETTPVKPHSERDHMMLARSIASSSSQRRVDANKLSL